MIQQTSKPTLFRLALASVCFLWLAGCTGGVALGPDAVKGQTPDGFIEMHEVQAAYIGSGSGGAGSLSRQRPADRYRLRDQRPRQFQPGQLLEDAGRRLRRRARQDLRPLQGLGQRLSGDPERIVTRLPGGLGLNGSARLPLLSITVA